MLGKSTRSLRAICLSDHFHAVQSYHSSWVTPRRKFFAKILLWDFDPLTTHAIQVQISLRKRYRDPFFAESLEYLISQYLGHHYAGETVTFSFDSSNKTCHYSHFNFIYLCFFDPSSERSCFRAASMASWVPVNARTSPACRIS